MTSDEEQIRRGWLASARHWTGDVAGRVMQPFRSAGLPPNATYVLSAQGVWVEQLDANVRPPILGVLRRAFRGSFGQQPPTGFDRSQYVTDYLSQAVNRMSNTPEQVYREIAEQLAQGVDDGETVPQLAARVQHVFDVTGNPFWENRAAVVARTEAQAAINAGTLAAAGDEQNRTRRPMLKVWNAVDQPGRTRPAHLAADGQTQPLTAPFIVDNEPLQYPGDPSGSAGNVIQCRCALTFRDA